MGREPRDKERARMQAITAVHIAQPSKMYDPCGRFKYLHSYLCIPNAKSQDVTSIYKI